MNKTKQKEKYFEVFGITQTPFRILVEADTKEEAFDKAEMGEGHYDEEIGMFEAKNIIGKWQNDKAEITKEEYENEVGDF